MRRKRIVFAVAFVIMSSMTFSAGVLAEDPELPNPPSLADKMKDPNFSKSLVEGTPIPESEMTRILLAKDWLLENDTDPDPWWVEISLSESWLRNPPTLAAGEETVELGVPTRLLADHNQSKDSKYITVSFPTRHFKGLPTKPFIQSDLAVDELTSSFSREDPLEYQERRWYENAQGEDDITGACGYVSPYDWDNDYDETFFTYHELEFTGDSGDSDFVEIISQLETNEGDTRVWIYYKIDNQNVFDLDCNVLVDVGDLLYYEYYVDYDPEEGEDYIMCWLEYDGDWYSDYRYDETAPDHYEWFIGSAELDPKGSLEEDFVARSSLTIERLRVDDDWEPPSYVEDALVFYDVDYASHVWVGSLLDESGLEILCRSYD